MFHSVCLLREAPLAHGSCAVPSGLVQDVFKLQDRYLKQYSGEKPQYYVSLVVAISMKA